MEVVCEVTPVKIKNLQSNMTATNTDFCLPGAMIVRPRETVIGSCSEKSSDISSSQIGRYVDKFYEELKKGSHNVKTSDDTFMCPYCPDKKIKRDYVYREILEHASGVGQSRSQRRSFIEKANHLALVKYLKKDLMNVGAPCLSKPVDQGDFPVNETIITKFLFLLLCY